MSALRVCEALPLLGAVRLPTQRRSRMPPLLQNRHLMWRSFLIAVIVGIVLVAINQGPAVWRRKWISLYWKIPLTFVVPYIVATVGALLNTRE